MLSALPWYIAPDRTPSSVPGRARMKMRFQAMPDRTEYHERTADPKREQITLVRGDWTQVRNKAGVIAWVRRFDDAQLVIAAPTLYWAIAACDDAIQTPAGNTDSDWQALRKQVRDARRAGAIEGIA